MTSSSTSVTLATLTTAPSCHWEATQSTKTCSTSTSTRCSLLLHASHTWCALATTMQAAIARATLGAPTASSTSPPIATASACPLRRVAVWTTCGTPSTMALCTSSPSPPRPTSPMLQRVTPACWARAQGRSATRSRGSRRTWRARMPTARSAPGSWCLVIAPCTPRGAVSSRSRRAKLCGARWRASSTTMASTCSWPAMCTHTSVSTRCWAAWWRRRTPTLVAPPTSWSGLAATRRASRRAGAGGPSSRLRAWTMTGASASWTCRARPR
mmetsp:Transcript_2271/g.6741  ORF Transcript_2271/g.6741 Transcript_2271/m.6741 type:complete len:270 (-) Transcript_2271:225-1034(-)